MTVHRAVEAENAQIESENKKTSRILPTTPPGYQKNHKAKLRIDQPVSK